MFVFIHVSDLKNVITNSLSLFSADTLTMHLALNTVSLLQQHCEVAYDKVELTQLSSSLLVSCPSSSSSSLNSSGESEMLPLSTLGLLTLSATLL